jgi:hypothetical protein
MFTVTTENLEDYLDGRDAKEGPIKGALHNEFKDFADFFSPKEAERLPPHRLYDYDIKL